MSKLEWLVFIGLVVIFFIVGAGVGYKLGYYVGQLGAKANIVRELK
jgi:hypothetical protein